MTAFAWLGWLACAPAPAGADLVLTVPSRAPAIRALDVACDPDAARWSVSVATDAWTGGGRLWLSADGAYRERHPVASLAAARDGSVDELRLNLDIAAEWTEASAGARTAFACGTPRLAAVVQVLARDGSLADCAAFGDDPARWSRWDAEVACAEVWGEGDTGE